MINPQKLLTALRKEYKAMGDPVRAAGEKQYLYSDLKHYGLTTSQRKTIFDKHKKYFKSLSKEEALELANLFWKQPSFEERSVAMGIVNLHKEAFDKTDLPWIEKWMRECKGWAFLDSFIIPIMPVILRKNPETYNVLKKWIKDHDFWVRRSALLAQLLLLIKKEGDKELFFDLARSQFDESWIDSVYKDTEQRKRARFFIRKAIGWTLRDMSKKDPESVFKFLKENKDKMSGLSYREGSRKLPDKWKKKL